MIVIVALASFSTYASGDSITAHGPIAEGEMSIRNEPYSLPQGFAWDTLDLSSPPMVSFYFYFVLIANVSHSTKL